jgi:predicted DNA-binding ArsR family transcriptional regulator
MAENEGHKEEMLKLIMEQNEQIKEMEVELEKLVKEKEQSLHMVVISLDAVPLIGISTTVATTTEILSAIPVKVPDASEKFVNSMEDMTL